jgi:predicted transcriptional regulator
MGCQPRARGVRRGRSSADRRNKAWLAEADAGEFATDAEVEATFEKWQRIDRDAD